MSSRRKNFLISFLKYSISLGIAIFLFWWVYGDLNFKELFGRFREVDSFLLGVSVILGLVSYYIRAFRWNVLLEPLDYQLKTSRTFLAIMIGYFANLLVPRMGEITRCMALKRTDNVDFANSFGSVVTERVLDMLILLLVLFLGLVLEFEKLVNVLKAPFSKNLQTTGYLPVIIIIGVIALAVLLVILYLYKKNQQKLRHNKMFLKLRSLFRDILNGFFSIRKLKRPWSFWISTALIWVLYFFMTYIVFLAFVPTMHLGVKAGILVLIMGGIGMATPVQGGVGSFHLLVSGILLLYGIAEKDGEFFAFVLHTSQFLSVLVTGGISFLISLSLPKRNARNADL